MSPRRQGTLRPDVSDEDHSIGPANAPVTLVEYGDYECPYCFQAHPIVTALRAQLGDKLRFVFRNFPLTQLHPHAHHAAEAAESVAANAGPDAYWIMHDTIFEHQQDSRDALDDAHLVRYSATAGADPDQVARDLEEKRFEDRVRDDFRSGVRSGVNGTPTFFINGQRFDGDWTNPREFESALHDAALATTPP
jgi:protein-disulfide isomerase